jgi:hypothetical protein
MKKKIIAAFAIFAVLGLAIAAYAYTQTTYSPTAKASCCCKGDSCPMKAKMGHEKTGKHDETSCPMETQTASMASADGHNCCCDCCGDSCPMKKKNGEAKATTVSYSEEGKDCCDDCDCCKGKHETTAAA